MVGTNGKPHRRAAVQPAAKSIAEILRRLRRSDISRRGPFPDLEIVRKIHRSSNDFIVFAHKTDSTGFRQLYSVERRDIRDCLEQLESDLSGDAYFSLNSFFSGDGAKFKDPRLRAPLRKQTALRRLNCCYVDLDSHKLGLSFEEVLRSVHALVVEEAVPLPSVIVQSGRGTWLLWLLRHRRFPNRAPKGDPIRFQRNYGWWRAIQQELNSRLIGLGADPSAKDGSRMIRVPGSINSKSGERVTYWPLYDAAGDLPTLGRYYEFEMDLSGMTDGNRDS
jgi:hypothetical protein